MMKKTSTTTMRKKTSTSKFRDEASFSAALCASFTRRGIFHQRIESGTTGRGIPDLYCVLSEGPVWVELKRVHANALSGSIHTVGWRPRQQTWMYTQWKKGGVMCYTLCAFNDCIVKVPMTRIYHHKIIDLIKYKDIKILRSVNDVR